MINNKQIRQLNDMLQKQVMQKFGVVAVAFLVIGSVAYFGTNHNQASHAVSVGVLSTSPASATAVTGSNVSVTISEDSGTDPVNAVQASLGYDATKLQYVSMSEGTAFPTVAATSTATAGTIRVGRSTPAGASVTGNNAVVTVTFKVLGSAGTTSLSFDPAFSFIVRSTDSVNIMTASTGSTYTLSLPAPSVTSVSPNSGPTAGGTAITVSGSNIVSGAGLTIGGLPATNVSYTVVIPTCVPSTVCTATPIVTINANTPAHASGASNVVVTNPDGQIATKASGFTYIQPVPTISTVTPSTGLSTGGTRVTIAGTNFVSGATVNVGGAAATSIVFVSASSLTATVPAHTAGAVTVTVTNPDGQVASKTSGFVYVNPAPSVTAINPNTGSVVGGTTVTISGNNFMPGATVSFGANTVTVVAFVSSTTLTLSSPAGTTGSSQIIVTNPDGQSSVGPAAPPVFTYLSNPGDANNDGRVNAIDLSILLSNDGQNYPPADFNGDGTIGAADLAILLGRWTW